MDHGTVSVRFSGDLAPQSRISLRTLGKALSHFQVCIDRAYIEHRRGTLAKYSRMSGPGYQEADILLVSVEHRSFKALCRGVSVLTERLIDRVIEGVTPALEEANRQVKRQLDEQVESFESLSRQYRVQQGRLVQRGFRAAPFPSLLSNPPGDRAFADRSMAKEIDQMASVVRSKWAGDSYMNLEMHGSRRSLQYAFDRKNSAAFHRVVSRRALGDPVAFTGYIRRLDRDNLHAFFRLEKGAKTLRKLMFQNEEDFDHVAPWIRKKDPVLFFGAPVIEYDGYDVHGGDVYFLSLGPHA